MKAFEESIKNYLKKHDFITNEKAFSIFKKYHPDIKKSTVNWRLYDLVQRRVIKRAGRGLYMWGAHENYHPIIHNDIKKVSNLIQSSFPLISYCIWHTDQIKEFFQHIPVVYYTIVEVEYDGISAILNKLKESLDNVYNANSKSTIKEILPDISQAVLVKTLVSEAPISVFDNVPSPLPEKIMVDLFCDSELFAYLQGNELYYIYQNILNNLTINKTRLLRYAARRGKKPEINAFLNQIIGNKRRLLP